MKDRHQENKNMRTVCESSCIHLKKVGFKIHVQKCANTFVDATQSSASEILLNGADVCFFFFQNNEQS